MTQESSKGATEAMIPGQSGYDCMGCVRRTRQAGVRWTVALGGTDVALYGIYKYLYVCMTTFTQ